MVSNGASHRGFIFGAHSRLRPPPSCELAQSCHSYELTYLKSGEFNFLELTVFDTHFTERDRLYRLVKLLHDSDFPLGIGIDENTALKITKGVNKTQFYSMGQGASWFIKLQSMVSQTQKSEATYLVSVAALTNGGSAELTPFKNETHWQLELYLIIKTGT